MSISSRPDQASSSPSSSSNNWIEGLQQILAQGQAQAYPTLINPDACQKRASVALIVRIRPQASHQPPKKERTTTTIPEDEVGTIDDFFDQDWVRHGDAEILFIKRAARVGDRWTSHVALPGGKREPDDVDDKMTAVRETWEEVGLDLRDDRMSSSSSSSWCIGGLPQRVVTTSWGTVPSVINFFFSFDRVRSRPKLGLM